MRLRSGYTLVEMVVTVALVAVLSVVAVSTSKDWLASTRVSTASSEMLSSILLARSEAVKRKARVVICKSANGSACSDLGGWEQGWIVFHDANNDRIRQAGESVLDRQAALRGGTQVWGNLTVANYISYGPLGSTLNIGGGFQAGTLTVCEKSESEVPAREIIIAPGGRPRLNSKLVAECP